MNIATRHTHVAGNAAVGLRTIDSGNPVMICGIVVANTDDAAEDTVTITDASGTTIMTIECNVNDTVSIEVPWLADAGAIVVSAGAAATTFVTVLWRPSG